MAGWMIFAIIVASGAAPDSSLPMANDEGCDKVEGVLK